MLKGTWIGPGSNAGLKKLTYPLLKHKLVLAFCILSAIKLISKLRVITLATIILLFNENTNVHEWIREQKPPTIYFN